MFGHDPREPPPASQSIPFIGHMVGLWQRKFNYYVELSQQRDLPIFTLSIPGQKNVVTKPDLIQTVQKQHRSLEFPPIDAKFASSPVESEWELPSTANTNVAPAVMEPDVDVQVEVRPRQGFEKVKWSINLYASENIFAMVTDTFW
ncbi:hypothetical protein JX266_012308 [Neoarthrinium moseri]|nr:hypothetical protein JX266_012308 [Neoarthrinium moseri]